MSASRIPNCAKCRHFFVTWTGDFPRGCKAYGFRSLDYPSLVVHRESGVACQMYEKRSRTGESGEAARKGRLVH